MTERNITHITQNKFEPLPMLVLKASQYKHTIKVSAISMWEAAARDEV